MSGAIRSLNYVTSVAPETPTRNTERDLSFSGNLYDIVVDRSGIEDSSVTEWETKKANLEEKEKTETGKLISKGGINALKSEDVPKTKDEPNESILEKLREEVEATMTEVVKKMMVRKSQSLRRGNGGRRGRLRIFKVCWKKGFLWRVESLGQILDRLLLFFCVLLS